MDDNQAEIRELTRLVRELLARVSRLEQVAGVAHDQPGAPDENPSARRRSYSRKAPPVR